MRGKTTEDGREEVGDVEDADTTLEEGSVVRRRDRSPSVETDVVSEPTSGDGNKVTLSGRQVVAKVALARDAGKPPKGGVMHVSGEYVHEKLGRRQEESPSFIIVWWVEAHIHIMVDIWVWSDKRVFANEGHARLASISSAISKHETMWTAR